MINLTDLQAKVTAQTGVINSTVTLLSAISAELKIALANNDQAALQAIADGIDANTTALAQGVAANPDPAAAPAAPTA